MVPGYNKRLDEIQAAFLRVKLPYLDEDNNKRRSIAERYLKGIKNSKIILPEVKDFKAHVFHLFVIRCATRDNLIDYLEAHNIQTLIHYAIPPHKQNAYSNYNILNYPVSERIHREVLSIPMHPLLTESNVNHIIQTLNNFA